MLTRILSPIASHKQPTPQTSDSSSPPSKIPSSIMRWQTRAYCKHNSSERAHYETTPFSAPQPVLYTHSAFPVVFLYVYILADISDASLGFIDPYTAFFVIPSHPLPRPALLPRRFICDEDSERQDTAIHPGVALGTRHGTGN